MKNYRVWVLVGGVLLTIGAALPWARWSIGCLARFAGYTTGLQLRGGGPCPASPAAFTASGGVILLLTALIEKGKPGKIYSKLAIAVSVLCGLYLGFIAWQLTPRAEDIYGLPSVGVFVSLLGSLLGFIGGRQHVPQEQSQFAFT